MQPSEALERKYVCVVSDHIINSPGGVAEALKLMLKVCFFQITVNALGPCFPAIVPAHLCGGAGN